MGAPIALFVVLPIVVLLLVGLVFVIRGLFFGAKETGEALRSKPRAMTSRGGASSAEPHSFGCRLRDPHRMVSA